MSVLSDCDCDMRRLFYSSVLAGLVWAFPALAGDGGVMQPRLVPGGLDFAQSDKLVEVVSTPTFSLGTLAPATSGLAGFTPPPVPTASTGTMFDKLEMGGYVAYSQDTYGVSSALRNRPTTTGTNFSASYAGPLMGYEGTTALTVGYDWRHTPSLFSPNQLSSGLDSFDTGNTGVSLSLSWNHPITPSLYLGGFAAAQHITPQADDLLPQPGNAFKVGAGVGVKF